MDFIFLLDHLVLGAGSSGHKQRGAGRCSRIISASEDPRGQTAYAGRLDHLELVSLTLVTLRSFFTILHSCFSC